MAAGRLLDSGATAVHDASPTAAGSLTGGGETSRRPRTAEHQRELVDGGLAGSAEAWRRYSTTVAVVDASAAAAGAAPGRGVVSPAPAPAPAPAIAELRRVAGFPEQLGRTAGSSTGEPLHCPECYGAGAPCAACVAAAGDASLDVAVAAPVGSECWAA
jgi:hypothetical protein